MKRLKVPLVAKKEVSSDEDPTADQIPQAVEEDRRHMVEAAIVRIMKARKTLSHNELIAEVTKQISLRFTPTPQVWIRSSHLPVFTLRTYLVY